MTAPFIHPTAEVSPRARLGTGVRVWNWAQIREYAMIGTGTIIGQLVYIGVGVRIGERCKIMPKAALDTGVELRDEVFVGPGVLFTNDPLPRAWAKRDLSGVRWVVGRGASLGAGVIVLPNVNIGRYAMIGAHVMLHRSVPPHALVCGSPARRIGWVCKEGHVMYPARQVYGGTIYACLQNGDEVFIPEKWRRWPLAERAGAGTG